METLQTTMLRAPLNWQPREIRVFAASGDAMIASRTALEAVGTHLEKLMMLSIALIVR